MKQELPPPLASLLSKLVDGVLNDADKAKLEEILRQNPAARDYYRLYLATHLELAEFAPKIAVVPRPQFFRRSSILLPIAAAIALVAGSAFYAMSRRPDSGRMVTAPAPGPVLAITTVTQDVRWSLPEPPQAGAGLHAGRIELTAGTLALAFSGNQILTLAAPTDFELIDENEIFLHRGNASMRIIGAGTPYVIRVPRGAVVDLGTEFSVKVAADGTADVWVFEGKAQVSLTSGSSTRKQESLTAGQSLRIAEALEPSPAQAADFIRPLPGTGIPESPAGDSYATAVKSSGPSAWWRFEDAGSGSPVSNEAGGQPLDLHGSPKIAGTQPGRHYLYTDPGEHPGFAMPAHGLEDLDTPQGLTIEFLCHSSSEEYGTLIAMELYGKDYASAARKLGFHHAPTRAVIERMARKGAHIGHVHPDFAIRGMLRSPASYTYQSGTNAYSSQSHLLHRWLHVALSYDGEHIRLFIDGELSSEVPAREKFLGESLRPVIGRVQPDPRDEARQWSGGIDEVAFYPRPLSPKEIRSHAAALQR
jgi:hypothetical protein